VSVHSFVRVPPDAASTLLLSRPVVTRYAPRVADEDPEVRVALYSTCDGRIEFTAYLGEAKWRGLLDRSVPEFVLAAFACEGLARLLSERGSAARSGEYASILMRASRIRTLGHAVIPYEKPLPGESDRA
jgi:hypothetical protein